MTTVIKALVLFAYFGYYLGNYYSTFSGTLAIHNNFIAMLNKINCKHNLLQNNKSGYIQGASKKTKA